GEVPCLAFSPDGKRLAWARGDTVTVRELPGGREVRVIKGHAHRPSLMAFSPDGARLATAGGGVMTGRVLNVKLWDTHTGQEGLSLDGTADTVTALGFNRGGSRLAATFAEGPAI